MDIIEVTISSDRWPYKMVRLQAEFSNLSEWKTVTVNASKFIKLWRASPGVFLVPPVDEWKPEKLAGIAKFLDTLDGSRVPMSRVGCELRKIAQTSFFGLKKKELRVPVIEFINGRHRAVFLHHFGADHFPVECHTSSVDLLRKLCGAD